jgi:uncharacterized protein YndB with AHSA1/START domain
MPRISRFELLSRWQIPASRAEVWAALRNVNAWPGWWPYVAAVEEIETSKADGLGACHRLHWSSRLPYSIHLVTRVSEVVPQTLLRAQASGDLAGEGCWRLADAGGGTQVEYLWRVELDKPWMQFIAPLARPVFEWNHHGVMAAGEAGLRGFLAR